MEIAHDSHAHQAHSGHHGLSQARQNEMLKFGWWVYIASEVFLFSSMIAVFLLAKVLEDHPPHFNIPLLSANTFLLLASSWMVVRALASAQAGQQKELSRALLISAAMGSIFLLIQSVEYQELIHEGVTLQSGFYGSAFFVLTGFHGAHVFIGVLWLLWAFMKSLSGHFHAENFIGIEVLGLYWHFVDVVWIVLFTLVYLLPL